jgi:hypothetical protein
MATTGQLSLPLDPMGISLKNLFVRNYSTNWIFCIIWMFLGLFYTWSIILVQIGNPTWLPGPIMCSGWLKLWRPSCQKLLSRWNCNIIEMMTGWFSTKFVIFVKLSRPVAAILNFWSAQKLQTWWRTTQSSFLWCYNSIGCVVSDKKIFKVSTNQNILLALAVRLDFRSTPK